MDQAVHHRVRARAQQLGPAPDRRHERVLEGALPALDGDGLGDPREHDGQVVPEDGADDQGQEQPRIALRRADQADRQRAGDGVDEERDLPAPVPAGEEEVALDEGVRRLQLMREESQRSVPFLEGCPRARRTGPGVHAWRGSCLPRRSGLGVTADAPAEPDERLRRGAGGWTGRPARPGGRGGRARSCRWRSSTTMRRSSMAYMSSGSFRKVRGLWRWGLAT